MTGETFLFRLPDGRGISYAIYGARSGHPVLFCHGAPGSRWQIQPGMADDTEQQGICIIAPERPGYGLSDDQSERTILDWTRDAAALMDHLGIDRFGMLGYSIGGVYALACGYALPWRVTGIELVSSIAPNMFQAKVAAAMSPVVAATVAAARDDPDALVQNLNSMRECPEQFFALFAGALPPPDQSVMSEAGVKAGLQLDCAETLRQGARSMVRDFTLASRDWGFPLEGIKTGVSIWHGTADVNAPPAMGEFIASLLQNSRLRLLEEEGHLAFFSHRYAAERAAIRVCKA